MSDRPDYGPFSQLSAEALARGVWTYYRWLLDAAEWEISFTVGLGGLFPITWERRTGRDFAALCAVVRREIGL